MTLQAVEFGLYSFGLWEGQEGRRRPLVRSQGPALVPDEELRGKRECEV